MFNVYARCYVVEMKWQREGGGGDLGVKGRARQRGREGVWGGGAREEGGTESARLPITVAGTGINKKKSVSNI